MNDAEALRASRARSMGYSNEPFYRGEATGAQPSAYSSAFFSRDVDYARGFAQRGGAPEPREFRLNLSNTFSDTGNITASRYGSLIEAAQAHGEHELANNLAETIAPGKGAKWVLGFSKANPDFVVAKNGAGALIRQAIEYGSGNPTQIFQTAGYDAIDSGRDVRKLSGEGIRLSNAKFDPARATSRNIRAGWLLPLAAAGLAYDASSSNAEAAGSTPMEARGRGATAGVAAGGITAGTMYGMSRLPAYALAMGNAASLPSLIDEATDIPPDQLEQARRDWGRYLPEWTQTDVIREARRRAAMEDAGIAGADPFARWGANRAAGRNPAIPR